MIQHGVIMAAVSDSARPRPVEEIAMHLTQVAQHAEDLDRAAAWYSALLGEPEVARFDPPGLVFFRLGRVRLLLDRAAPTALLYLQVPDLRQSVDRLRANGTTVETEPHVIFSHDDDSLGPAGTDEWQAFVRDSEGNLVGLVSHLAPAG
jgi:methylmalonyl-CoA/ethylmalonyl-CoA epimerase